MERYLNEVFEKLRGLSIRRGSEELGFERGMGLLLELFLRTRREGKTACFIGNGGSAAIAVHMTSDFFKNGRMRVISLLDLATITCLGNDYGYEHIFSKQAERMLGPGDLLVAVSSSGRSPSIVNAISAAHENGAVVLSLTGFSPDNPARAAADYSVYIPSGEYGIVESSHNLILQELVDKIKERDAGVPAVFLDRDGVLCEERGYLRDGDVLRVFPFAAGSVRRIHSKGFLAIVVTNQSGVARGFLSEDALREMNRDLIERTGVDAVYYCPHLEGGAVPAYSIPCDCRKPKTGLIDRARRDFNVDLPRSWLVGDRASDVQAGIRAGLRTALVRSGYSTEDFDPNIKPDCVFADLEAFAEFL